MYKILTKIFCLMAFLIMLSLPSLAQNTKGDRPSTERESRFRKTESKKKFKIFGNRKKSGDRRVSSNNRPPGRRRIKPRSGSDGARNVYPQSGRFVHNNSKTPSDKPRVARRSASGGSVTVTTKPKKNNNVYPSKGRFVHNNSRTPNEKTRVSRRTPSGKSVNVSSKPAKNRNVYSQRNRFVHNPSSQPRDAQRTVSNRSQVSRSSASVSRDRRPGKRARVQPRSASRSYIANKTINIQARFPRPRRNTEKASTRDIAGRRLRTKNYESKRPEIIKSQSGTRSSRTGRDKTTRIQTERYGRYRNFSSGGTTTSRTKPRVTPRSVSGTRRKVYSQTGRFVNNPSAKPRKSESRFSDRSISGGFQTARNRPGKNRKVAPRSASRPFLSGKSTNMWARFPRPKKKGEVATTTDIAGKKLRTKNYESPRPGILSPEFKPYQGRKRVGDRPYRGPAAGGFSTATKSRQRAWIGDIARRAIRGNKKPKWDTPSKIGPGGYRSATRPGEKRTGKSPLPVRQPGVSAEMLRHASGKVKGRRSIKGGGSVSGRLWNNRGNALQPKAPGSNAARAGSFQGNIKTGRPAKGGGSVSGRLWNNKNRAIPARTPGPNGLQIQGVPKKLRRSGQPGFLNQGEEFTGTIKTNRPAKGGGSVSGKVWNNRNKAIINKVPPKRAMEVNGYPGKMRKFQDGQPGFNNQGEEYTGSIKAKRPAKGGGSVSGKLWNNKQSAIAVRTPGPNGQKMRNFSGNIKASRPAKGGGSVSGKLWNNKETPIVVRTPGPNGQKMRNYQGDIKASRPKKGGGSVSGKLWNNNETPIIVRIPNEYGRRAEGYSGNVKLSNFRKAYVKNPNSAESALKKSRPTKSTYQEDELQTKVKQYNYIRNKAASENATRVREPGKSFARASDFQGNIKMKKFQLFERNRDLHPDARFIRTNKNNVDAEKDALTNFKLWWARLFKKAETQPDHLKEKERKPRYDKGEQGLWYE